MRSMWPPDQWAVLEDEMSPASTSDAPEPLGLQELGSFLALETREELVVDRSAQGELLRINFNISYPALSCEFATLDVSDALGTVPRHLSHQNHTDVHLPAWTYQPLTLS